MSDLIEQVEAALASDPETRCGWRPLVVDLLAALKAAGAELAATRTTLFAELAACEDNLKAAREVHRYRSAPQAPGTGLEPKDD